MDDAVGMQRVRFLDLVRLPPRLASLEEALGAIAGVPPELGSLCRSISVAAGRGMPVDKELVLDLAGMLLEMADLVGRRGRRADALVLEGLEGCLLEALLGEDLLSSGPGL